MSTPARSSASAMSVGGQGGGGSGNAGFTDDISSHHFPTDIISVHDRKEEALTALKSELVASLQKEVKSLDEDSWKFARPRSQIHIISRPGKDGKGPQFSLGASEQDIEKFFSFSFNIEYVEMQSGDEWTQVAYVTFEEPQGAETALLLSSKDAKAVVVAESAVQKAEDVISAKLAKGFIPGKDALNKAKDFDEKHQFTSTASAKVSSLDKKIGLSEQISMGTSAVNEKVRKMDQKFQISEKMKSAFAAAEQKVSSAGVAKAASDVGSKTNEKVAAEQEHKRLDNDFEMVHLSETASCNRF